MPRDDIYTRTEDDAARFHAMHAPDPVSEYEPDDPPAKRPTDPPDPEWVAAYHAAVQEARRLRGELT